MRDAYLIYGYNVLVLELTSILSDWLYVGILFVV
jgi:hypothetical protein